MLRHSTQSINTALALGLALNVLGVNVAETPRESKRQRKARLAQERYDQEQAELVIRMAQEEQRKAKFIAQMKAGKERKARERRLKAAVRTLFSPPPVVRTLSQYRSQ